MIFNYRKLFGLSYKQVMAEPSVDFFTNLLIYGFMQVREQDEIRKNG